MSKLIIFIAGLILLCCIFFLGLSFGDSTFHPKKVAFPKFTVLNNTLTLFPTNGLSKDNNYIVQFSSNINIKNTDSIHISYDMDRMKLIKVTEIFVNDVLTYNQDFLEKETVLTMTL